MKRLLIITSALCLAVLTYAGEVEARKSCDTVKKCCSCEKGKGTKPEGKCCADKPKEQDDKKPDDKAAGKN